RHTPTPSATTDDTALSLHDALPISDMEAIRRELRENPHSQNLKPERTDWKGRRGNGGLGVSTKEVMTTMIDLFSAQIFKWGVVRSEEHTSELQSRENLVCRLLLEKK